MPYKSLPISQRNPGLIIIMIDQSESMRDPFKDDLSKADFAARAVNKCIYEIIAANTAGEAVKDRCHLVVIGYGQVTEVLAGGRLSELRAQSTGIQQVPERVRKPDGSYVQSVQKIPIWVEPRSENGTPMQEAFDLAGEVIRDWLTECPHNFPPIVINVTDGQPNDPELTHQAAVRLLSLHSSDGGAILFNAHIGSDGGEEIVMPASDAELPDDFAKELYSISSLLPEPMIAAAQASGIPAAPGSHGFVMNARADMFTKMLVFGTVIARR